MNITVEEVTPLTRRMRIVLPVEEVSRELDDAYRKLKSEVSLKGFRRGKAPRTILEQAYGDRVRAEVGEKLVQASYFDAVEQEKIDAVVHPEIKKHEFPSDGTFVYEAEVDVRPVFELGQYKGLEIERTDVTVSDADVDAELERMRKEMAPLQSVEDRGVCDQDVVTIDFQGYQDGAPIPQVHGESAVLDVGSGRNGEEFEGNLVGMAKGEEKRFEVTFDAQAPNPVLAGKTVEFRVTVNEIKQRILAALDDEFARDVSQEFSSLDDLKKKIREQIEESRVKAQEGDLTDKIMFKLLENNTFEVPSRLVRYEIEEYIQQTESHLQKGGLSMEAAGINRDELGERYREAAERRVRGDFILKKIAETEDIKVDEKDITAGFERIANQYNMKVEQVKEYFKKRDDLLPFMNEILNEKILKFLLAESNYVVVPEAQEVKSAGENATSGEDA